MEAIADRVAIGIENARLYEETQRHSEHLAQTLKLSELLHSGLELEQVLEQIAQGVLELGFQVAINVREPEGELVRVRAVTGMEGPERETLMRATYHWSDFQVLMQERFQISHSYFIRQGELDWEKDFRGVSIPAKMEDRGPGYWRPEDSLLVPLWGTRGEPLGLLSVDEPADGLLPDLNTIQTLEAFANQAAIAIENARLFEDIEERRMYLEGVLGAAPDAIVTMDAHHRIVEWNSGAERLFGNSWEEVVGQNIDDLITSPDVFEEATEFTQVVTGGMEVSPTETVRYRKDGSPVDVIVAGSPILVGDKLIGAVAVYTDITARKRMEEALLALSLIDELTGLYNRRGFVILSQHQLKMANRARKRMLLLFADFDDLKAINDAFGHPEGDRALIEVADALRETFRESDIIARIGGDEFVVLAMEISRDNARIITTRLQENLEARNARAGRLYKLSLGVGIALYDPEQPCSINDLMAQADKAMYEHKRDSSLRYPETSPHPSPLPNGAREHVPSPSQGEG
jgi:diguanylate cyclase (GGDEF)-like protein/PAS domain S-box-containing protein